MFQIQVVKTPTQLQRNLNPTVVGGWTWKWLCKPHPTPPPAISQLLLAQFWSNFKGRFLGPSWTDSNCHVDICPGNIWLGDICPYQEYLSCYWPNSDQTFWPLIFWTTIFLDPTNFWTKCSWSTTLTTRTTTKTKTKQHQNNRVVTSS